MIKIARIKNVSDKSYAFVEDLLVNAFPVDEYRDLQELRKLVTSKDIFHCNLIYDDNAIIGFITYWNLGNFYYVEHFATHPDARNNGYGKLVLEKLQTDLQKPIVLEVERPTEVMSKRRIEFYKRQGFKLWSYDYRQPPYRPGGVFLDLFLMVYGSLNEEENVEQVKSTIYREVYGYKI